MNDNSNNTWVVKEDAAYYLNNKNKSTQKITINGEKPSRFHIADTDSIWMTTRSQNLYKVHEVNKGFRKIEIPLRKFIADNEDWIHDINFASKNEVIISTVKGSVIHYKNNIATFSENPETDVKDFNGSAYDQNENLWLASFDGLIYKYNIPTKTFTRLDKELFGSDSSLKFNCLYFDSWANCIWISSRRRGLFKYDLASQKLGKYIIKAPSANIIDSENILNIIRDPNTDVLYLGSDQHGILVWDPYLYKFDRIDPTRSTTSKLGFRLPRKLEKDNYGNVWIGSVNTGLWRYNKSEDKLDVFTTRSHPEFILYNSSVQLLHQNDTLWVGHNGSGISKLLLPQLELLEHFMVRGKEKELDNINVIWNLIKDSKNRLWIGTRSSGVFIKDGNHTRSINKYNSVLTDNTIYSIVEDNNKDIVICTQNGGLYKYFTKNDSIIKVFPKESDSQNYSSKTVLFDQNNMIWYATDGKGLLLLDQDYNIVTKADSDNGVLKNDAICSLILNDDNSVWASTNYGLYKLNYNQETNSISSDIFTEQDGLTSNEFMTGAYLKTNDTLWMGNMEGVNFFMPKSITKNPHVPTVHFKQVEINNRITQDYEALRHLKNNEDNIAFEYNTIGHTIPSKTLYSYRLMGYDSIWSKPSPRTFSRFTNLNPGNYQFQVKACNYDGVWNEKPLTLDFSINPLIWQTLGFQVFLIMMSLLTGMLFYTYRINLIKKEEETKNKYLKEITQMEMRALRAQINPHFLFNTLNSINSYILQQDDKTASRYLVKFSKLMRMILSNSSHSYITLEDEMKALDMYIEMESMRFGNSFDYFLNTDKNIDLSKIFIPPMLLQPFVENAIWHGLMHKDNEKVLSISIKELKGTMIEIKVVDNGIGRSAANKLQASENKRKSYGMDITKKTNSIT